MDSTPNLSLPYILAAQAQKHVTHNEAIRSLDALVQLSAADKDLSAPPASPVNGARYLVAAAPIGAWAGQAAKVAAFQDGAWAFFQPLEGWLCWVSDENKIYAFDGAAWGDYAGGGGVASVNPVPLVGVNATADTTNRLSVAAPGSLFNHEGAGHQQKINKAAAANTASTLYQTAFSGRAEVGLAGDDNYHLKVSPDGASWKEALVVDRSSGVVSLPFTPLGVRPNMLINGDFGINQRGFAFGALANGVYGVDRWKAVGASNFGWVAATQTLTINAGAIQQLVEPAAFGYANLASTQITFSVDDLTNGSLGVAVGSVSGTITAGAGRRSVTLTLGAGDTGNIAVTLTPATYPVWFKRAKLETGAAPTEWQARPLTSELQLCQRYYLRVTSVGGVFTTFGFGYSPTTTQANVGFTFPVAMRAIPTFSYTGNLSFTQTALNSVTGVFANRLTVAGGEVAFTGAGFALGGAGKAQANNSTAVALMFDAEI